ncbi:hypothetical protein SAICODRAFT_69989 [Saitoella complicata NRRL Y-17804]|nr:uncharacterized protein SAICODRAFT_69989 [Saitoella complicata NRRL Y-17804]ODQ54812.1 hypothetical protein SAICODRAFT_69989 [Saitoella complicata NRRL Y-17804]
MDGSHDDDIVELSPSIATSLTTTYLDALSSYLSRTTPLTLDGPGSTEEDAQEEREVDKMLEGLNLFQEQPHLLDPFLPDLITPITDLLTPLILSTAVLQSRAERLCKILYTYSKLRSHKIITTFLPPDVYLLEPLLSHLSSDLIQYTWQARYVLLLWAGLVFMAPFDLQTIDSATEGQQSLVERAVQIIKVELGRSGKERDAAAILAARVLTRKDVIAQGGLRAYTEWCNEKYGIASPMLKSGILASLAQIYRSGERETLRKESEHVWGLIEAAEGDQNDIHIRKLRVKLASRIGSTLLPPRHAKEVEEGDVSELVDAVIDALLTALRDASTITRYSAAKNLAALTSRLPLAYQSEVVDAVLAFFEENGGFAQGFEQVNDALWHGATLCLAEFARRGVEVEDTDTVRNVVLAALKFEQRRSGTYALGAHVRDAACYAIWSMVRSPVSSTKAVVGTQSVAEELVIRGCFDREINVRRAASAAFQEGVGRMGIWERGIEVLGIMDFFAVGVRRMAALDVGVKLFALQQYRGCIVQYLVQDGVEHWDLELRTLVAKCLEECVRTGVEGGEEAVVDELKGMVRRSADATDVGVRQGLTVAISAIIRGSASQRGLFKQEVNVVKDIVALVGGLPPYLRKGVHSGMMLTATCVLITALADAGVDVGETGRKEWLKLVHLTLAKSDESTQEAGAHATRAVFAAWDLWIEIAVFVKCIDVRSSREVRRGYAKALGVIAWDKHPNEVGRVVRALLKATEIEENEFVNDGEARRDATHALALILKSAGARMEVALVKEVGSGFLRCLEDYAVDSRGDIGSWVRREAMYGLTVAFTADLSEGAVDAEAWKKGFSGILKQSVEKLDKLRSFAGECIKTIMEAGKFEMEDVAKEVLADATPDFWASPGMFFPKIVELLVVEEWRLPILSGLMTSAGGAGESLLRAASTALSNYLEGLPDNDEDGAPLSLTQFMDALVAVIEDNSDKDRVIIPCFEYTSTMFDMQIPQRLADTYTFNRFIFLVQKAAYKTTSIPKLLAVSKLYAGLASLEFSADTSPNTAVKTKALGKLVGMLRHPFPRVRAVVAEQLYLVVSTWPECEEVECLLVETDWMGSVKETKGVYEELRKGLRIA